MTKDNTLLYVQVVTLTAVTCFGILILMKPVGNPISCAVGDATISATGTAASWALDRFQSNEE